MHYDLIWTQVIEFLHTHEYLAVWAEGIALVAIFVWDRIDARAQHRELVEQIEITKKQILVAQQQAETAQAHADLILNAERPYLSVQLSWKMLSIQTQTTTEGGLTHTTTWAPLTLHISNFGRTPAWINGVWATMKLSSGNQAGVQDDLTFEPDLLAPQERRQLALDLKCPGEIKAKGEELSVRISLSYQDSFHVDQSISTSFCFTINPYTYQIRRGPQGAH